MAPGNCVDRQRPACCPALERFVHAKHRDDHNRKVAGAKSTIQNSWSVKEELKLQPSRRNFKNEQVQDDRFADIERENMRLLLRMQELGKRPDLGDRRRSDIGGGAAGKAAARIVLGGPPQAPAPKRSTAASGYSVARSNSLPVMGRGSNNDARMKELRRIDQENQRMMKRIVGQKSTMNRGRMDKEHQEQQRVMRMRQANPPEMPRSRIPLPFSAMPPSEHEEDDSERIEGLHAQLQRRVQELEQQELHERGEDCTSPYPARGYPGSPLSAFMGAPADADIDAAALDEDREAGGEESEAESKPHIEQREFIAGQMPEHSRLLVEKLFEDQAKPVPQDEDGESAQDGRDAVARMLAAADALDAQEFDPLTGVRDHRDYLCYDSVIQRSRNTLASVQ